MSCFSQAALVAAMMLVPSLALGQPGPNPAAPPAGSPQSAAPQAGAPVPAPAGGAGNPAGNPAPAGAAAEKAHIEGFRSAQWGMTEAQVKAAIQKDFGVAPDKVKREDNLAERTGILTVTVPDLLDGPGPARVSYLFGYSSKKLIQINVLWGTPVDPHALPDKVVAAANQLRQLFLDAGYEPETLVANAKMNDGSVLVFQGEDADKHTTILRLASAVAPAVRGKPEKAAETVLSLSYIMDARHPDIYRLKKGQF